MRQDLDDLISRVDIRRFYQENIQLKGKPGEEIVGLCPFHDDKTASFAANATTGLWHCFTCGISGSIFQFIEKLKGVTFKEAVDILARFAGTTVNLNSEPRNDKSKELRPPIDSSLPEKYHANLLKTEKTLPWIKKEKGLSLKIIKKYKLGWDGKRITFPVYDEKGALKNIRLYHPKKEPKLLSFFVKKDGKVKWVYGESRLYGLDELFARPDEPVYLHEGEWDKLLSSQHGNLSVCGTTGAGTFKPEWKEYFKGRDVVIIYDMDPGGRLGAKNAAQNLVGVAASVKNVKLPLKGTKQENDYSDFFLKKGGTIENIRKLVKETPLYVASKEEVPKPEAIYRYPRPVFEKDGMYQRSKIIGKKKFDYPITNFVIIPKMRIEFEGAEFLRAQVKTCQGIIHSNIQFGPESWISKPKFKNALSFLDVEFTGSDADIQNIGGIIAEKDAPRKKGVIKVGLHHIKGKWVYVEEKLAWDADGQRDDIIYLADDPYKVNLLEQPDLGDGELDEILSCLFSFNEPDVLYPLLGWCFACFVKERIFLITKQNPILICWGEAGSGKSMTLIMVIQRLHGIQTPKGDIGLPTTFTFAKVLSSSNLAPVLYDEFKTYKIDLQQQKIISGVMGSVFNQSDFTRGKATLEMVRWIYSAPMVIAGEMKTSELAIQDRIVETYFSKKKIKGEGRTEAFEKLRTLPLGALGKDFLLWTLKLKDKEIRNIWKLQLESVDKELTGRLRENTTHARVGLALFSRYLESKGKEPLHADIFAIIDEAQKRNILEQSNRTIVDTIIEAFSVMVGANKLIERTHFKIDPDWNLNLHIPGIYPEFRKWARETSWDGEILNQDSFTKQLQDAKYYLRHNIPVRLKIVKKAYILNLSQMKHLAIEEFTEALPEENES